MNALHPFHLAIPVREIEQTRKFYREVLGLKEGRSDSHWVDFDFFGHQLVIHVDPKLKDSPIVNPVDGKEVPVPHFGLVLPWDDFHRMASRLGEQSVQFVIEPYIRFEGKPGEQATMFFRDPSGNALEFKAFRNPKMLFATSF